ncbi:transketolase [Mucilaginibacter sp. BJC16-A38]|uniref:transketolase family protein n=1 Tax=Mucilaginibacter phenanthrenivorans TaxID=1234842 RepID=UPI00215876DA|nr:transketolase C-terminal domain-containing protein [Mucilaginibacter phenanthrenivorans]MCR8557502.1 transketolase [Mucilaginibacter phenanthrenivorans]
MTYEELLTEIALSDERFIVMTAENRALVRNIPGKLGNRFIDTGITEQTMIGAAAGLALRGRIPVVHALASFLSMRAFEFVRTDAGIPNLPIKLSSFIPGFLSDGNGPTHQALEDISLMRGIPNMTVFAPADEDDLVKMLPQIWNHPGPSYVRINTCKTAHTHTPFELGKAEIISTGDDVTILTYGLLFEQALIAVEILKNEGLSVGLVNMRSLKPVDERAILEATRNSSLTVTLEDHFLTGGLYSIVAEVLLKHGLTANVLPFALNERWFKPTLLPNVLQHEGFTGKQIAEKILGYKTFYRQPEMAVPQFSE